MRLAAVARGEEVLQAVVEEVAVVAAKREDAAVMAEATKVQEAAPLEAVEQARESVEVAVLAAAR